MGEMIAFREVEEKIISIGGQNVLLDRDVAELYGVETKRVNEAVRNNADKFPEGYIVNLKSEDWECLRSKFSTLDIAGVGQYSKYKPKAFTEKGLYMLATILKSERATQTTIAIVEAFSKIRELSRVIYQLPDTQEKSRQNALMQNAGKRQRKSISEAIE
jgi:phage regulator Rha-like protein